MDILDDCTEQLQITTIIDDCKERIFDFLEWTDLINVADTSKKFYPAVCRVFKRKYKGRIDVGSPRYNPYVALYFEISKCLVFKSMLTFIIQFSFEITDQHISSTNQHTVVEPDIFVTDPGMALKLLRIFGPLIVDLHICYYLFFVPKLPLDSLDHLCRIVDQYLANYCAESLNELSLAYSFTDHFLFEHTQKVFHSVKTLSIQLCVFKNVSLNNIFPNVRTLKLGRHGYYNGRVIKVHFAALKY